MNMANDAINNELITSTPLSSSLSVGSIATNYAIFFSFLSLFFIIVICVLCCCCICCKSLYKNSVNKSNDDIDDKENHNLFKRRFDVIPFDSIYANDGAEFIETFKNSSNKSNEFFGIDEYIVSELTKEKSNEKQKNHKRYCCCRSKKNKQSNDLENNDSKMVENKIDDTKTNDNKTGDNKIDENKHDTKTNDNKTNDSNTNENKNDAKINDIKTDENTNDFKTNSMNSIGESKQLMKPLLKTSGSSVNVNKIKSIMNDTFKIESTATSNTTPKKIYLHYSFDNMSDNSGSLGAATVLANITDDSKNVFRDLEAFVEIVIRMTNPKEVIILLKISSPGGYAYKFELAYTHLMRLRNAGFQIIALIDDICASGGYMLASACNTIICSEYATIGSIGVITTVTNYNEFIRKIGFTQKTITTGLYKNPCPGGEPLEQQQLDLINESVQETLVTFRDIVQKSRNLSNDEIKDVLSAKVWYGKAAVEKKLIDQVCSSNEYLSELAKNKDNRIFIICHVKTKNKSSLRSLMNVFMKSTIKSLMSVLVKIIDSPNAVRDTNEFNYLNKIV